MKIKTQFIVCIVVFSIILVIIAASVATTTQLVAQLKAQESTANDIEQGAGNLNSLSIDYFLYQQDSTLTQWHSNFSSISNDLSNMKLNSGQQLIAANVSRDLQGLSAKFNDVVSYLQSAPRNVSIRELLPEFQNRWGNMTEQSLALIS